MFWTKPNKEIELAKAYVRIAARNVSIAEDMFDNDPNEYNLLFLERAEKDLLEYKKKLQKYENSS
jgi:hypothetical protein